MRKEININIESLLPLTFTIDEDYEDLITNEFIKSLSDIKPCQ